MKQWKLATRMALGFGILLLISISVGGLASWEMMQIKGQSVKLSKAYMPQVDITSDLERYAFEAMHHMRGFGFTQESQYLDLADKSLSKAKEMLDRAKRLADAFPELAELKQGVSAAETGIAEFQKLTGATVEESKNLAHARTELDSAGAAFMTSCAELLNNEYAAVRNGIGETGETARLQERLTATQLVNDIIDIGNHTSRDTFGAQALRDTKLIHKALESFDVIDKKIETLTSLISDEQHKKLLLQVKEASLVYRKAMAGLIARWTALDEINMKRHMTTESMLAGLRTTARSGMTKTSVIATGAAASLGTATWMVTLGLCIAILLGSFVAIYMTLSITKPVKHVSEGLARSAVRVSSVSTQVSSASQQLAEGAAEQSASIAETSLSLTDMTRMTRQNADDAANVNQLMIQASNIIERANGSMSHLTASMRDITSVSEQTQKIVKTIDEISFQTNLLALNAAVEAARAGDAGSGFAVVADEVRNLALRAAEAARNTAALIEGTVHKVREGSDLVEKTNVEFTEVSATVIKAADLMSKIAAGSGDQARGIERVNAAVAEMDKVTQRNSACADQSASASEEMGVQAELMNSFIRELFAIIRGGGLNGAEYEDRQPPTKQEILVEVSAKTSKLNTQPTPRNGLNVLHCTSRTSPEARFLPPGKDDF